MNNMRMDFEQVEDMKATLKTAITQLMELRASQMVREIDLHEVMKKLSRGSFTEYQTRQVHRLIGPIEDSLMICTREIVQTQDSLQGTVEYIQSVLDRLKDDS